MAFLSNLHTHTVFSDGVDTMEAYVRRALEKGFVSLGFSDHAYAAFDPEPCMLPEQLPAYRAQAARLRAQYAGRLEIYTGTEYDYLQPVERDGYDYLIGSVHYVRDAAGRAHAVDHSPERFRQALQQAAGGNIRRLVQLYYASVADMALRLRPDIVGHMNLLTKFNDGCCYFGPEEPWYLEIVRQTVRQVAQSGCLVEVNTAGYCYGDHAHPYPHVRILQMLHAEKVPVTISSDAHSVQRLDDHFAQAQALLREVGYRTLWQLQGGRFVEVPLA